MDLVTKKGCPITWWSDKKLVRQSEWPIKLFEALNCKINLIERGLHASSIQVGEPTLKFAKKNRQYLKILPSVA